MNARTNAILIISVSLCMIWIAGDGAKSDFKDQTHECDRPKPLDGGTVRKQLAIEAMAKCVEVVKS
jgi:hypothetical protein